MNKQNKNWDFQMKFECGLNRKAYGDALVALGKKNKNIVVLDADLSTATRTIEFSKLFPNRFFNLGIAEQNIINVAAGMSIDGKIPYVSTFPMFGCGRAFEQIRYVALENLNVNFVFTHAGLSLSRDGCSHQMLEDIALMRVLPNMHVFVPSDVYETFSLIHKISQIDAPCFVRLPREENIIINYDSYEFEMNRYPTILYGEDIIILTMGNMIEVAIEVAEEFKKMGIGVRVVNVHTIKPLNATQILKLARETNKIVTLEEHNILGGLGSAISELLSTTYPLKICMLGINDAFGCSGAIKDLYIHFGLDKKSIFERIKDYYYTE